MKGSRKSLPGSSNGQLAVARLGENAWIARLEQIVVDCTEACADDQRRLLREMFLVLRQAPHAVPAPFGLIANPHLFEAMLESKAWESAALALLGVETGYLLSRGPNQVFLASVYLPGMDEDVTAEGASGALALIAAQAAAMAVSSRSHKPVGLIDNARHSGLLN